MLLRLILSGLLWCSSSISAVACYLIQTKGAGELKASSYWQEGEEIRFYFGDDVMGVLSSDIQRIIKLPVNGVNPCRVRSEPELLDELQASDDGTEAQSVNAVQTAIQTVPSEVYLQFESDVIEEERAVHRLDLMSTQELIALTHRSEALKTRMLSHREVGAFHGLLARVDAVLDRTRAVLAR